MSNCRSLPLALLVLDSDVQPRETMSSGTIQEYATLYREGHTLAPITVFQEDDTYWVADGFHRVSAAKIAGLTEIEAEIQPGNKRDAMLYACGANKHGKVRTNEDKRRVITRMLEDLEWQERTDNAIAKHCGVSQPSVSKRRKELKLSYKDYKIAVPRLVTRNGTTYPMITNAIGSAKSLSHDEPSVLIATPVSQASVDVSPEALSDDINRPMIEQQFPSHPAPLPLILVPDQPVPSGKRETFNRTNDMVDWAKWTWNPVTGCLHNCIYCYARDIAERFYPQRFEPTFKPERLSAPYWTHVPKEAATDQTYRNVFVCSMADLFGKWVPQEWIDAVLASVREAPQWTFLFLTKFPQRLASIAWPENAWVGTTVDEQYRVPIAEKAFREVQASVKWLSCEPLRERLTFTSLTMFDWLVIGGQSASTQAPAFQPPWEWVEHLWGQAREAALPIYWKENLLVRPKETPWDVPVTPSALVSVPDPGHTAFEGDA